MMQLRVNTHGELRNDGQQQHIQRLTAFHVSGDHDDLPVEARI